MRLTSNLLLSILLSGTISFMFPMILFGILLGFCLMLSFLPYGMEILGNQFTVMILDFLAVFGNGKPLIGAIIISITCCFIGIILDLFNSYRY